MTAALVADYYGETNNAINYGSIYAFKALGGSFAGGLAAFIMTGTCTAARSSPGRSGSSSARHSARWPR